MTTIIEIKQHLKDKTITATGLVKSGLTPVYYLAVTAGSEAATLSLFDSLDGSGTAVVVISTIKNATLALDWSVVGPRDFPTGCYATLTGTGSTAHLWYA